MNIKKLVLLVALVVMMTLPAIACNSLDGVINRGMNNATESVPSCGNIVC